MESKPARIKSLTARTADELMYAMVTATPEQVDILQLELNLLSEETMPAQKNKIQVKSDYIECPIVKRKRHHGVCEMDTCAKLSICLHYDEWKKFNKGSIDGNNTKG